MHPCHSFPARGCRPARAWRHLSWLVWSVYLLVLPAGAVDFPATWQKAADIPISGSSAYFHHVFNLSNGDGLLLHGTYLEVKRFQQATQTWRAGAAWPGGAVGTAQTAAAVLSDGRVLVVDTLYKKVYLYDPAGNTWQRRADYTGPKFDGWPEQGQKYACAIPLPNGDAYIFSGRCMGYDWLKETFFYRMARDTWEPGTIYNGQPMEMRLMPCGKWAGHDRDCVRIFDPVTVTWTTGGDTNAGLKASPFYPVGSEAIFYITKQRPDYTPYLQFWAMPITLSGKPLLIGDHLGPLEYPNNSLCFTASREGQDWFGIIRRVPVTAGSKDLRLEADILVNRANGSWARLPDCPVLTYGEAFSLVQPNGVLIFWQKDGVLHSQRLYIQPGPPRPPMIADTLAPITLPEGDTTTFTYQVTGDLPPEGIEVLVERMAGGGGGDLQVFDGIVQRVMFRSDVKTVRIAARTDANGSTDIALVRVRIVLSDGSIDPNARIFQVTIPDRYTESRRPLGDVNGDGVVNALDLDGVVKSFGQCAGEP